jgi:hypothetical protein
VKEKIQDWYTEEDWKFKFDMSKVKWYLEEIKDNSWAELKNWADSDKWVIAVQIALNFFNAKGWDYNDKCSVKWLDGIRKWRTRKWVKGFQTRWNELNPDSKLSPDWAPGKETIKKILEVLWWYITDTPVERETLTETETQTETPTETETQTETPTELESPRDDAAVIE